MRPGLAELVQVGVPFTWLGAVLGISFLETPLKFRAPGITVALGLGIGRLVFRALTAAELVLAAALTTAMIVGTTGVGPDAVTAVLVALWILLAVQVGVLRPRLNGRTRMILAGETPPRSHLHLAYIALEGAKVVLLVVLGVLLVLRLPA
ncbi:MULTISPECIES: hypothetical protein [unclassified Pseudonocardia]|jgi:hypothetical protein|uniref:hypothetical protein n=1 Tax=unclassified Pseudonocardia TaxID=2619320 RepID=UPI00096520E4|nr:MULTISPECIES: hypothetical protein [unclassified Pseudonocardia]MBN9096907.1 hypothetical protein [Pseudonocardia sp.]OJY38807.1 MAG: hypothetical protein BGP03_03460 [Pseudonocardia sp. 73-21]